MTAGQGSSRQESGTKQNVEKLQFMPIPMTYRELYQSLFDAHVVAPFYLKPLQPPYPKWYDANAQCEYHAGITGHSIENCTTFKKLVERFIQIGIVKFDNAPSVENLLPNHTDSGVNAIDGNMGRRIKADITKVKTHLKWVWKVMAKRGLVILNLEESCEETRNYCEFHHEEGHKIQECKEFRASVQGLMDNKEIEFCEEVEKERISGKESSASTLMEDQDVGSHTCSGKRYDLINSRTEPVKGKDLTVEQKKGKIVEFELPVNEPVKDMEAKEFLKFLKHSEYSVVEQLHKKPARISILALLLSSEVHRSALMKVLNKTYVTNDISVNKLDRLVNNISADNFIFFNDNEIPPGGMGSTKALHITTRCKRYTLLGVLIDNGDAPYLETDDEAIECSFWYLEFGSSQTRNKERGNWKKRQEKRRARLGGEEIKWEPRIIPHISKTFVSGGIIYPKRRTSGKENIEEMLGNVHINAIFEEVTEEGTLSNICPYEPGNILDNWTTEEIPVIFRTYSE
ncbi:hypothetical protein PVK06_027401 [Gossypium arboreum]|uniref:Uncharacterized protein n=1 Tax=Gossypium arboreum TaxID=29729 RepID=A0ABR0P2R6_GOSAR|nr:hypothetical protein PVK06_027401 [Gossypium arboreum]